MRWFVICLIWTPIVVSLQQKKVAFIAPRRFERTVPFAPVPARLCATPQRSVPSGPLIPKPNPYAQSNARSSSGIRYETVLEKILELYPAQNLDERNAISRKDGYWPYIQKGTDPPKQLTYGEFDFYFFAELLDRAVAWMNDTRDASYNTIQLNEPVVFCDLGSGTGRLVLSAAALHPDWQLCRGIELLPGIANAAEETLTRLLYLAHDPSSDGDSNAPSSPRVDSSHATSGTDDNAHDNLHMAPVEFECGSFVDPYVYFGDANVVFCFATCMEADLIQNGLAHAIGRQCKPGTIVITTDMPLPLNGISIPPRTTPGNDERIPSGPFELRLLEQLDGYCWLTGGSCTAYMYQVVSSLWTKECGRLDPPVLSTQDVAFEVVRALEAGELNDTPAFLRNVNNNMVFHGLPFVPKNRPDT